MGEVSAKLTVYFENPFWVGVYERVSDNMLEVCKITFGSEPKDYDVHEFLLQHWQELRFSQAVEAENSQHKRINPKRLQREISSELGQSGIGTKAQQALKLQHEQQKQERKTLSRQRKEERIELQFQLRQQKKKEKHKGK